MAIYLTIDEDNHVLAHSTEPADHIAAMAAGSWFGAIIKLETNGILEYAYDFESESYAWVPVINADDLPES